MLTRQTTSRVLPRSRLFWVVVAAGIMIIPGCLNSDSSPTGATGGWSASGHGHAGTPQESTVAAIAGGSDQAPEETLELTNPYDRDAERLRDRAGEHGTFSWADVMRAKEHIDQMPVIPTDPQQRDAGLWVWEWLGPANVGGRIRSILIHPNTPTTMWIGAVSGGIWKTTNGGVNWSPINDFLPSLAVSTLVMHPTVHPIMYAGTGEMSGSASGMPGAGVLKSTDGGDTWTQLPGTGGWEWVNRLAIDPNDGDHLLAATDTGIAYTNNGGGTWSFRDVSGAFSDVRFSPVSGMNAIAANRDLGRILYSVDGGVNWNPSTFDSPPATTTATVAFAPDGNGDDDTLSVASSNAFAEGDTVIIGAGGTAETARVKEVLSPTELPVTDLSNPHAVGEPIESVRWNRTELAYAPSNPATVYASMDVSRGTIWRSFDGGTSFHVMSNGTENYLGDQGRYDNTIWVAPNDPALIVVGGIELWRSTNSGATLTRISHGGYWNQRLSAHPDQHVIVEHPGYDGVTNKTVFFGNDGGIQKTDDIINLTFNSGWTNLGDDLGITQFYGGAASPDGEWIMGGTQDNDSVHLHSTGGPGDWFGPLSTDGGYCAINYDDPQNPVFYKEAQWLNVKRSIDQGQNYELVINGLADTQTSTRFIAPFVMDPNTSTTLVAGGTSIWRTMNSADNWASLRPPISEGGGGPAYCSAIDIAVGNSNRIWVGYDDNPNAGGAMGRVSRTTTNVITWVDVDNNGPAPLPNRMVNDIAISPHNINEVFVVFQSYYPNNAWYTPDNGATWEDRSGTAPSNLPAIHISTVRWHPTNPNWVYLGTDLGVFASEDKGLTWSRTPAGPENEGPANTIVDELFWQGDYLLAATHGRGMYRTRPLITVYVDWTNTGFEDGSWLNPFNTVKEAIDVAGHGTGMSISTGDYNETNPVIFDKRGVVLGTGGTVVIR